eukprot:m.898146 g.898146  ORF g.898146 m.898146 type:complete len:350 (-) comp23671_c1_seq1:248-1297(-)
MDDDRRRIFMLCANHEKKFVGMASKLSPYERQRQKNISENQEILRKLHLALPGSKNTKESVHQRKRKTRLQTDGACALPTRKSRRLAKKDVSGLPLQVLVNKERQKMPLFLTTENLPSYADRTDEKFYSNLDARICDSMWRWDVSRTHQHLEVSPNGMCVATVGCAGYGAALCKSNQNIACGATPPKTASRRTPSAQTCKSEPSSSLLDFKCLCVKQGVGGFAVGFVLSSFVRPYKSLGKHPMSWVYHSSGSLWHDGKEREGWGQSYDANDIIRCVVSSCGNVTFSVNGVRQGSAPHFTAFQLTVQPRKRSAAGKRHQQQHTGIAHGIGAVCGLVPAVQPYMGGVAQIC